MLFFFSPLPPLTFLFLLSPPNPSPVLRLNIRAVEMYALQMVCLMLCSAGWQLSDTCQPRPVEFSATCESTLNIYTRWCTTFSLFSQINYFLNKGKSVTKKSHDTVRSLPFMFNDSMLLMYSLSCVTVNYTGGI